MLNTLTPAERAHYEVLLLQNGAADKVNQSLAVLNDMLARGQITQEQYDAALERGSVGLERQTAGHQAAAAATAAHTTALQVHNAAVQAWLASTDPAIVAAGQWAQAVDAYATKLAQATPALAAQITAAKNSGDTETTLTAIMQAENLTRDEAIAKIQAETVARQGAVAATKLQGEAAEQQIKALELQSAAAAEYAERVRGMSAESLRYFDAVKQVLGIEEALRRVRESQRTPTFTVAGPPGVGSSTPILPLPGTNYSGPAAAVATAAQQATAAAGPVAHAGGQEVGSAIDAGLVKGIVAGEAAVGGSVRDLVSRALRQAKDELGIKSPSTVAAQQVGLPSAQGIGQGIRQGLATEQAAVSHAMQVMLSTISLEASGGWLWDMQGLVRYGPHQQMPQVTDVGGTSILGPFGVPADQPAYGGDVPGTLFGYNPTGNTQQDIAGMRAYIAWLQAQAKLHGDTSRNFGGAWQAALQQAERELAALEAEAATAALAGANIGTQLAAGARAATPAVTGLTSDYLALGRTAQSAAAGAAQGMAYLTLGTEQAAQAARQAEQAWAQALRAGQMLVAGINTGTGLTYGQIYGNSPTQAGTGSAPGSIVNLAPGNYYGLPVVSPLTGGTLRGYANGGWITEPVLGRGLRSGAAYAIAEEGPEYVGRGGQGAATIALTVNAGVGAGDLVRDRRFWERIVDEQLRPVLQKRRLI